MIHRISTPALRTGLALSALCIAPAMFAASPAATEAVSTVPAASSTSPAAASMFTTGTSVADVTREFRYQPAGLSSSSDDADVADASPTLASERESLADGVGQPPPGRRRSYGRSRYQDRWHNADGSTKIAFVAGAGLNVPAGNTAKFYTPSYTISVGAGFNFNKMFGVLGELHYDHMGLTGGAINYQYNNYITYSNATPNDLAGLDANAHVLALTVNPIVNFVGADRGSRLGAYVTGGVGFYHKVTNFTLPQEQVTYYYSYITNATFDSYSANGFGANGGVGMTYKLSEFGSERLFLEARYHWIDIQSNNNADFFPFNRRNTEYIPITAGIRF